jgi:hypothetical protein
MTLANPTEPNEGTGRDPLRREREKGQTMTDPDITQTYEGLLARVAALETLYGISDEPVADDGTQWFPTIAGYTRIPGTTRYIPTETEARS